MFTADVEIGCNLPEGIYIETSVYITIYDGVQHVVEHGREQAVGELPDGDGDTKDGWRTSRNDGEQRSDFWILVRPRHADRWDGAHQRWGLAKRA